MTLILGLLNWYSVKYSLDCAFSVEAVARASHSASALRDRPGFMILLLKSKFERRSKVTLRPATFKSYLLININGDVRNRESSRWRGVCRFAGTIVDNCRMRDLRFL